MADLLRQILAHPDEAEAAIEAELGRQSLAEFTQMAWSQVEPDPLLWNWHHDAMCEHLEAVHKGDIKKLLILVPPGCTKSLIVATFFPAWEWILDPTLRYIYGSYQQDLSNKNAKLHRDLVASDWFQARWPHVQISKHESKKVNHFQNSSKGFRFSTSVTGAVTGRHADRLVFDDLAKAQDAEGKAAIRGDALAKANDFWFKVMPTRRANPKKTRMIGIMQRLHYDDPAGKCIDSGEYTTLMLPMEYDPKRKCVIEVTGFEDPRTKPGELLWPDRFSAADVKSLRKSLGSISAAAQLDQNPSPLQGAIFNRDWFRRWDPETFNFQGMAKILTVDCSFKDADSNDFVAIQCWTAKDNKYYLLDQLHGHWGVTKTVAQILRMKLRHRKTTGIWIEDKANGPAVFQILKDKISGIHEWSPGQSSKVERAYAVQPLMEALDVLFPPDDLAPWMVDLVTEHTRFPVGTHDDQVDALTMALLILHERRYWRYKKAVKGMVH